MYILVMSVLKLSFSRSSIFAVALVAASAVSEMSCAGQYADPHRAMSASLRSACTSVEPEESTGVKRQVRCQLAQLLSIPVVLMMFPRMELHWKKKKKMPKNLTTTCSGSDPSRPANL